MLVLYYPICEGFNLEAQNNERMSLYKFFCRHQPQIKNNILQQDRKRQVAYASSIKLNLTNPCRIKYRASTTAERFQAGRLGQLFQYMRECNDESPKQGSKRFNSQGRQNTLPIWVHNLSMTSTIEIATRNILRSSFRMRFFKTNFIF